MNQQELLYIMALTMTLRQQSKPQHALLDAFGSATAVFENRRDICRMVDSISPRMAERLAMMDHLLPQCEQEIAYAAAHNIRIISITDEDAYPARLRRCDDAPLLLYVMGNMDLNARHIVSIVGTRRCTERGRDLCRDLAAALAMKVPGTLIVSGLAYGIDIAAHRAAIAGGLPTAAVLAHGLDEIYPREHRAVAVEMLRRGGLVTEFTTHTPIDRLNFLQRNRIVAGLADAVVVVESPARGGSLNTARLAADYHREVLAFPGRPTDLASEGCNLLIRRNGATLITSPDHLIDDLGWEDAREPSLFTDTHASHSSTTPHPAATPDEQRILDALAAADGEMSAAALAEALSMAVFQLPPLMLSLEMKGIVKPMAGNRYHLVGSR